MDVSLKMPVALICQLVHLAQALYSPPRPDTHSRIYWDDEDRLAEPAKEPDDVDFLPLDRYLMARKPEERAEIAALIRLGRHEIGFDGWEAELVRLLPEIQNPAYLKALARRRHLADEVLDGLDRFGFDCCD